MTWGEYIDEEVEEEKNRLLAKLVKDGSLTIERAAKELDMSVEDFEEKFMQ